MTSLSQSIVRRIWHIEDIDFSVFDSIGLSGGMLIQWKKNELDFICSFRSLGYLGIIALWKNHFYYIINVYSGCSGEEKRMLWKILLELKSIFIDGEW